MTERGPDKFSNPPIIPADQIARAYEDDAKKADEEYLGEELIIRGEILRIDNVISAVVPRVRGSGEEYSGTHLKLHLKNREDAGSLAKGEEAVLRGVCRGLTISTSPTGDEIGWITLDEAALANEP